GELRTAHHGVNMHARSEVVLLELRGRAGGECLGERLNVLRRDREAGRGAVTSPAPEQIGARPESSVQVEGGDRAPGARPLLLPAGDEDDRPVETLDEPRGGDSDYAATPALAREHVAATTLLRLGPLRHLGQRFAQAAVLDGLAVSAQPPEPPSPAGGL